MSSSAAKQQYSRMQGQVRCDLAMGSLSMFTSMPGWWGCRGSGIVGKER
jgi:hypothetical protein